MHLSSFTEEVKTLPGATASSSWRSKWQEYRLKRKCGVETIGIASNTLDVFGICCAKQIRKLICVRNGNYDGYAQRTKGYRIWLIDENKLVETIN
ncbi:hypothetical protein TNCV_3718701, partial [Trichonephila clavipes]